MILTYFLLITSQLAINCNCLKSFTLEPPEQEPFRLRAGSFTVVSADHQGIDPAWEKWVIKAGRLLGAKNHKLCDTYDPGESMTSGRSLMWVADKNHENGTYAIVHHCSWEGKFRDDAGAYAASTHFCLDVRQPNTGDKLTTLGLAPKYLFWNEQYLEGSPTWEYKGKLTPSGTCKYFYITAAYDNEKDMFNIFYKQDDHFWSPSCCVVSNDNVNVPFVDDGLTMCKCDESDINIIKGKPVIKKGIFGYFKKLLH